MKKKDLKTGMIAKRRDGSCILIVASPYPDDFRYYTEDGVSYSIESYCADLTYGFTVSPSGYDIVAVAKPKMGDLIMELYKKYDNRHDFVPRLFNKGKLLWEGNALCPHCKKTIN